MSNRPRACAFGTCPATGCLSGTAAGCCGPVGVAGAPPASTPRGQWQIQRFEESCGKLWRWEVRVTEGKRESRRVEVRKL